MFTHFSSICSCASPIFSTALYSHFCLKMKLTNYRKNGNSSKKYYPDCCINLFLHSIKFQNLVRKVSVSALYYLPIPKLPWYRHLYIYLYQYRYNTKLRTLVARYYTTYSYISYSYDKHYYL